VSGADWLAVVASVVLTGFAAVLAIAETTFTHLGKARAKALDDEVRTARLAKVEAAAKGRRADADADADANGDGDGKESKDGEGHGRKDKHHAREEKLARAVDEQAEAEKGDGRITSLVARRDEILPPLLLLGLICHLGVAVLISILAYQQWGATGAWIAFALLTVVIFVLAEAIPKTYALQHTARAATRVAPLVSWLALFPPVRWLARGLIGVANVILPGKGRPMGPTVTEEELLAFAGAAAEDEVIEAEEQALIRSIIEFGDTVTREVMVPRTDMITVEGSFRVVDAIEVAILNGFSRLPATGEDGIDDIIGVVYAKDLMRADRDGRGERPVAELARRAHFVPEAKRVPELLREMQAERFHLAIVVDEYGATAGIATLEDLIEELVGEIRDEYDVEEPMVEPLLGGGMRVNAKMDVDDLAELLEVDLPDGDWDSVGGLVVTTLGQVPKPGEEVEVGGLVFRAERVTGRRVGSLRVTKAEPDDDGEGDERRAAESGANSS
jgi:CBS domain containing-hemolysin-like protein